VYTISNGATAYPSVLLLLLLAPFWPFPRRADNTKRKVEDALVSFSSLLLGIASAETTLCLPTVLGYCPSLHIWVDNK